MTDTATQTPDRVTSPLSHEELSMPDLRPGTPEYYKARLAEMSDVDLVSQFQKDVTQAANMPIGDPRWEESRHAASISRDALLERLDQRQ